MKSETIELEGVGLMAERSLSRGWMNWQAGTASNIIGFLSEIRKHGKKFYAELERLVIDQKSLDSA